MYKANTIYVRIRVHASIRTTITLRSFKRVETLLETWKVTGKVAGKNTRFKFTTAKHTFFHRLCRCRFHSNEDDGFRLKSQVKSHLSFFI